MFRIEAEVDKDRHRLLGEQLEADNAERSPAIRRLRGTPHGEEVPLPPFPNWGQAAQTPEGVWERRG